jgi:hypothetical protein
VDPLDDEYASIVFDFTTSKSLHLSMIRINLARCQRAGKSAQ